MLKTKMLCVLLVLLTVPVVWSGQISPYLADRMQGMLAAEQVDVIVMMQEQADISSLNSQLKIERSTLAERNRRVIEALQDVVSRTQPAMIAYLDELQSQGLIERYKTLWAANMFIVTASKAGVEAIAAKSEVADLYFNYTIESIKPVDSKDSDPPLIASHEIGLERINALEAWAAGFTGAGRVVSNMDTGVDGTHPALADRFRGDVDGDGDVDESWYDPYAGWTFPQDSGSHGTHTMGTICGRTPAGDTIGVAIDAQWIAAAPIDRGGGIPRTVADALLSFEWFVDPDGDPETQDNPDACGNSWGISPIFHGYPYCDETFWVVIDNLEAAGTAVIFSAGNEGSYGENSLRTPADRATTDYNVFSIGSVNGANPSLPISSFSSRGPCNCTPDGSPAIKPEVVAPGENVRSSVPGGGYSSYSGTSMASPHITGAVAVIRSANPDLDVDSIKEILMATSIDLGPEGEDNSYGHGIIDLYEACLVAQQGYGFADGYVYDENSDPIENARINVQGTTRLTHADENGYYFLGLPADTSYTLLASYFGFLPDSAIVTITADDTVSQDFTLDFAESGVLHGYVTDLEENPIDGATVEFVGVPVDPVYTDGQGYYIFENIPGGSNYDVRATAIGYGFANANVFIAVDDTTQQDFALQSFESFEENNAGWSGEGVWQWGAPSSGPGNAYDGDNVWATNLNGQYPNNADDDLITTAYEITGDDAYFAFQQWFDIESGWDGGNVSISTNGGSTWSVITPDGGYPDNSIVGLDGEPGYTGSSDWVQAVFDLSSYNGQTVLFKFRFGTDGSVTRDGWYLDAVLLSGGGSGGNPIAEVSPSSFSVELNPDASITLPLTVSNDGVADLNFTVSVFTDGRGLASSLPDNTRSVEINNNTDLLIDDEKLKFEPDPPFNYDIITDFGGPDDFGYTYIDSDEPNGPEFDWVEISDVGDYVDFTNGSIDDGYTDPLPMDMAFEFYGQTYNDVVIGTNGWISFQSQTSSHLSNESIPDASTPNAVIAVEWDDLDGGTTGTCYKYYDEDNNRFIISWLDWYYYPDGSTPMHDFQVIFNGNDNSIIMQYGDIDGDYQSDVTVGIENEDGTVGLQYAYNNALIVPGLAIKYSYPAFWLTVSPLSGTVAPGQSTDLDVTFDAAEVSEEGTYTGQIVLSTNDPDNSSISVPCTLVVGYVDIGEDVTTLPVAFSLSQNYPNPFNPTTDIAFGLPSDGHTTLDVYDIMGRKVKTLLNENLSAGVHQITWNSTDENGNHVSSGVYFYKLVQGDKVTTKKMMMVK